MPKNEPMFEKEGIQFCVLGGVTKLQDYESPYLLTVSNKLTDLT
jgi:hypothetical protein